MGLEIATFIHQLDPANPVGSADPKSQGDDHIRTIKDALLNTFTNIEGAVTATHTELNKLAGATLTTAELNKLTGVTATTADLNKTATLVAANFVPTLTAVANVGTLVNREHSYIRVGSIVFAVGSFTLVSSGGTPNREIGVSLPIASALTNEIQAAGSASAIISGSGYGLPAEVYADAAADRLHIRYYDSGSGLSTRVHYSAMYRII